MERRDTCDKDEYDAEDDEVTSVDEDILVDKHVDLLGCAIFCLVTICRRTEPAGDEERAYENQEERRRGRRRFDVCSLLRNHPDSWTEGGGLGCVGDHCVHVFSGGLNANIIIPPNRVTIIFTCWPTIHRCFHISFRTFFFSQIRDTAQPNV